MCHAFGTGPERNERPEVDRDRACVGEKQKMVTSARASRAARGACAAGDHSGRTDTIAISNGSVTIKLKALKFG